MPKLVLASNNQGKLKELQAMLAGTEYEVCPQSEFDVSDVAETGSTFVENALIKARHACDITGLPALADDSGLCVAALKGEPGIYSARFAGEPSDAEQNNAKLLQLMQAVPKPQRQAYFYCVIVLMQHAQDPTPLIAEARWQGEILTEACGSAGFGYDPLFYVPEQGCASAELEPQLKNKISHRGQAIQHLLTLL